MNRAQTLEREKKDMENLMAKAAQAYELERATLNNRITSMTHELHVKGESEAKVAFLEVSK